MTVTTQLDIVSAEREVFSGVAEMVVATGELGEMGIVPGHAPLLALLKPGEVRVTRQGGAEEIYYISGGMIEIQPYYVTILADEVERAENLDEAAALAARARAQEAIANKDAELDYTVVSSELARAAAQIRAIQKIRKHLG